MRKPAPDRLTTMAQAPDAMADGEISRAVYEELRRLASSYMRRERPGQTLQTTALVHEAYLRLAGSSAAWQDERQFVGFAARAMRRILVDRARARGAAKRWGALDRVSLTRAQPAAAIPDEMLLDLDEALQRLAAADAELAHLVELRFFAGLTNDEAADALGISSATLKRRWSLARAWLFRELNNGSA